MLRKIAILTGGPSQEHDIAVASAQSVQQAIETKAVTTIFIFPEQIDEYLSHRTQFECVIPVFHGRGGEDGSIQGFLETLQMPYVFSSVTTHALAIDKVKTNSLIGQTGISVPENIVVHAHGQAVWKDTVVVKPLDSGSSIGVTIAHDQKELDLAIQQALKISNRVLVEEYVAGQEFSVAVIDVDGKTEALPVISIEPKHDFFDFESKYQEGLAVETCPADISGELATRLQQAAVKVHQVIGAKHVSRSDFIVDAKGTIWFLEVNTIPGMSVLLPKAIAASGRDFGEVIMGWVESVMQKS